MIRKRFSNSFSFVYIGYLYFFFKMKETDWQA